MIFMIVETNLIISFRDEPARHVLSRSGSKSHNAEAPPNNGRTNQLQGSHAQQADQARILVSPQNIVQQNQKSGR